MCQRLRSRRVSVIVLGGLLNHPVSFAFVYFKRPYLVRKFIDHIAQVERG